MEPSGQPASASRAPGSSRPGLAPAAKAALLCIGHLILCALAGVASLLLAIALAAGKGAKGAGDVLLAVLVSLALLFLGTLPVQVWLVRRWTGRLGLALALGAGSALLLGGGWLVLAFLLAVVLNR